MEDPYRLERFVQAQDRGGTYEVAVAELRTGRKASHWIWFIFPGLAGVGYSPMAKEFGISSLAEAQAYLRHPVLGPRLIDTRLIECTRILLGIGGKSAEQIFGDVDAMKVRSSMTLFMRAVPDEPVFREALDSYFNGSPDPSTIARL